jgi:protease II
MILVWEGESQVHCIVEHHHGRLYLFTDAAREGVRVNSHYLMQSDAESPGPKSWKNVFLEEPDIILEDVDFCSTHMVLILRQGRKLRLCSVNLPLPENIHVPAHLSDFHPFELPLPNHVCQILSGPNYDYQSSTMRFTISSPVVCVSVRYLAWLILLSFCTILTWTSIFRFALHTSEELIIFTVWTNTIFLIYASTDL